MTKFGKTGDFPRGKFSEDDEGGIQMGVAVRDKTVIINFGTPVAWLGLPKDVALQLAATIKRRAEEINPQPSPQLNPDLPKLLRAIAASVEAKHLQHDVIFNAAADELDHWRGSKK